jgi:hypothetical protein
MLVLWQCSRFWKLESCKEQPSFKVEGCCWPRSTGYLKVVLLRFYSCSTETPPYLRSPANRKWQWGATEIVQIAVHHVDCCQLLQIKKYSVHNNHI